MWRAILVDDEEYVRAELAALFPWSRYQFELVGEADNGRAAIDLVNAAKPDLVITDIRMPDMDGLALIARLADVYPQPVVVVVSAYNDFPYVREALRLGAADYLMKAEATLETAAVFLGRLGEILEERYRARNRQAEMTSNIARYHCLAKESFWRDTLTRASDLTELEARANQLGIVLENMRFGLTFVHVSHAPKTDGNNRTAVRLTLDNQIRTIWNRDSSWEMIEFKWGDFIILSSFAGDFLQAETVEKLQQIACRLAQDRTIPLITSASSQIGAFSDLPQLFKEVREVNLLRLYPQGGRYFKIDDLLKLRQASPPKTLELLTTWERALRCADHEAIHDFLNHVFEAVIPISLGPEEARWMVLDFVNTLRRILVEYQVHWEEIAHGESTFPEILEQAESIRDWQIGIEKLVDCYLQLVKASVYPQVSLTIRKALMFIQSNFTRDLSLEEVACHAGVSKSYLCRVFPEYAGEHFSDYLQRLRVERAKELLLFTNDHIYEIATKVGFWNSRYFSKVFHDMVGMTPADYRRIPSKTKA